MSAHPQFPRGYTSDEDAAAIYDDMKPGGGVGPGTLVTKARQAGAFKIPPAAETFAPYLATLPAPAQQEAGRPNIFSTRQQDRDKPATEWLFRDLIEDDTDALLVAPSKYLKSFLAVDIACRAATGKAFGPHAASRSGRAFYCAGEGGNALKDRVLGWEVAHGAGPYTADRVHIATQTLLLNGDNEALIRDAAACMAPGERGGILITDTLNRALNGADEDKSSTASAYFNVLKLARAELKCPTLTVHHMGKDVGKGARGSSAFYAGFDTVIVIDKAAKDEATGTYFLTVRVDKQKNGPDGQVFFLQARKVQTPNGPSLALYPAAEGDLKRAAGKLVGLRRDDVAAALAAMGACPDGANEWTGKAGGIPTRQLAIEIARARHLADGDGLEVSEKEIDVLVAALNKGARQGGPFDAYVVREGQGGRQWAIAPGPISTGSDHA